MGNESTGISPVKRDGEYTGQWLVDIVVKGKRYSRFWPSFPEAKKFRDHCKKYGEEPPPEHTFRAVALKCLANGGPRRKWRTGKEQVPSNLRWILSNEKFKWTDKHIDLVTTEDVEEVIRDLKARPVTINTWNGMKPRKKERAESTINRYLDAISAVYKYAVDVCRPRLAQDKIKIVRFEEIEDGRLYWLEEEQEKVVVQWLVNHGYRVEATLIRFFIATGLRANELQVLTPEQIRHDHVILYAKQTKGKAYREAFLHPDLAREVRAIVATAVRPVAARIARIFKKAVKATGYPSELTIHSLRHTCAARYIDKGVNLRSVQLLLGHKHYKTTERYAKVRGDYLREAAQKVAGTYWETEQFPVTSPTTSGSAVS